MLLGEIRNLYLPRASLVFQTVKRLPKMQENQVWSLGQEDPLEKEMATHPSTLAWKVSWMEEPGRLQSMWSQRVGHELLTLLSLSYLPRDKSFRWGAYKRHQRQLLAMMHSQPLVSTMVPYPQAGFVMGFLDAGSCQKSLSLHDRMQCCRGYLCKGQSSVTKLHGEGSWAHCASNFSSITWS